MSDDTTKHKLPPWFTPARPTIYGQECLFKVSLESALAQAQVSPDALNRWHSQGWISFAFVPMQLNDPADPKLLELHFVRDVVRSGLTDAQITQVLDKCPKPHSFDPDLTAFSFRYGLVQAIPPIEPDEPETVIETHLDEWIEDCDAARLAALHEQILKRLNKLDA
jgi:hypothetical protein